MSDDNSSDVFEGLFGRDDRTDEERDQQRRRWDEEANDREREAFERERDRRADYLAMDQRIRNIVSGEINKLIVMGVVIAAAFGLGKQYGWLAGVSVVAVALFLYWRDDNQKRRERTFGIGEVDELAEETVQHERLVAMEREGRPLFQMDGEHLTWEDLYRKPYWQEVNAKVRSFVGKSHADRLATHKAARLASLPFRRAVLARLRERGSDKDLPYWARIRREEEKG